MSDEQEPKKRGPKPFRTEEEKRLAANARRAKYVANNLERCRAESREASKRRKAAKAIAEGRVPGRIGNQKRQTPEERKAYLAEWRAKNADKIRDQDAALRRNKRHALADAEGRVLKIGPPFQFTEEERVAKARAQSLAYWRRNPERKVALAKKYHENNRDKDRVKVRNRRARKRDVGGTHSVVDIELLWSLQKGHCTMCLGPLFKGKFHVDHYMPLALGGSNDRRNLHLLHKKCNLSKGARHPADHAKTIGLLCW